MPRQSPVISLGSAYGQPMRYKAFEAKVDAEKHVRMVEKKMDDGSFISQKKLKRTSPLRKGKNFWRSLHGIFKAW